MSKKLTIVDIAEDLSIGAELDGYFVYTLTDDEQAITVEQYGEDGDIVANYRVTITIEESNA